MRVYHFLFLIFSPMLRYRQVRAGATPYRFKRRPRTIKAVPGNKFPGLLLFVRESFQG